MPFKKKSSVLLPSACSVLHNRRCCCHLSCRDLKPENILLTSRERGAQLKVIDFGTSEFCKAGQRLSKKFGTPYYVAPEVGTLSAWTSHTHPSVFCSSLFGNRSSARWLCCAHWFLVGVCIGPGVAVAAKISLASGPLALTPAHCTFCVHVLCPAPLFLQVLRKDYSTAADVWSAGVIMFILLSGYPPFSGSSDARILQRVQQGSYSFAAREVSRGGS